LSSTDNGKLTIEEPEFLGPNVAKIKGGKLMTLQSRRDPKRVGQDQALPL